jgi:hypothetical protein
MITSEIVGEPTPGIGNITINTKTIDALNAKMLKRFRSILGSKIA